VMLERERRRRFHRELLARALERARLIYVAVLDSAVVAWLYRAWRVFVAFWDGFADVFRPALALASSLMLWFVRAIDPDTDGAILYVSGEHKIMEVKKHWYAGFWSTVRVILSSALLVWNTFYVFPFWDHFFYWLIFSFGLGVALHGCWDILSEFRDRFVITNQRIFRINGVLGKARASIPILRILDITTKQSILGRFLHYGHFIFESAAQIQGLYAITFVANVDRREDVLRLAIHGDEMHEMAQIPEDQDDVT
jgi:membrane protein YdbS with pleckstrin-like domain